MRAVKILVTLSVALGFSAQAQLHPSEVREARERVRPRADKKVELEKKKLQRIIEEIRNTENEVQDLEDQLAHNRVARKVSVALTIGVMAITGHAALKPLKGTESYHGQFLRRILVRSGVWAASKVNVAKHATAASKYLIEVDPEDLPELRADLTGMRVKLQYRLEALEQTK